MNDRRTGSRRPRARLTFCQTCNARERMIVDGRCVICDREPGLSPLDVAIEAELAAAGAG